MIVIDSKNVVDFGSIQGEYRSVEIGERISFSRAEYEHKSGPWLTDNEFRRAWDRYIDWLSMYFEFQTTPFIANGHGAIITIMGEKRAGAAVLLPVNP